MKQVISRTPAETRKIAADFAARLSGGEVVALFGVLGAGKTEFVRGLARQLGVRKLIQSPTFVLEKNYAFTRKAKNYILRHLDLYRIKKLQELTSLQLQPPFKKNTITIVEWPQKMLRSSIKPHYNIWIRLGKNFNERIIRIETEKQIS